MFIDIRNLQERRAERDSQFEDTRDIREGYLFEVNGSVEGDRDGLVWFKARDGNSQPFQVFYTGIIGDLRANMPVKIERVPKDPDRWQIKEFDRSVYFDDQSAYEQLPSLSAIPAKEDYEWPPGFPGAKALNIFPRAITDFAVRPTSPASMKARVYSGIYPGATNYARFQGPVNTKDFTADIPGTAGLALLAAISIDNTGTLNYTNGTTFVDGLPMPDASLPAVPASQMLISAIRLVNGMTAIEESNFDLEMRPLMANGTVNVKVSEVWESDFGAVAMETDASGNVTINAGTLTVPSNIIHLADPDNSIGFTDDVQTFTVGGKVLLLLTEAAQDVVKIGDGTDVDINLNDRAFGDGATGNWGFGTATPGTDRVAFQSDSGANLAVGFYTGDGDGTDFVSLVMYGVGTPGSIANRERLLLQYDSVNGIFKVATEAQGTGTLRPLVFETEGNSDQVHLDTSGNVGIGLDPTHTFELVDDDGAKTTTTTWTTTSDRRVKRNIKPFTAGTDYIKTLPQIKEFEFNGAAGTPRGERGIGFLAQDLAKVAPTLVKYVGKNLGKKGGKGKSQLATFNPHELIFALINTVIELDDRITVLEA